MADSLELETIRVHTPHNVESVHIALLTYATTGNYEQAGEITGIHKDTIRWWVKQYPGHYQKLAQKHAASIEKVVATKVRTTVLAASHALDKAVALEEARLEAGDVKDAAASARNLATVMGIGVTKILELEGRPTSVVEHRNSDDAIRQARAQGWITGTATEEDNDHEQNTAPSVSPSVTVS